MLIIGDELIPFEKFEKINDIKDISNTSSNSIVYFSFSKEIMSYCMSNCVEYAVKITSLKEAVYANAMGAKYVLPSSDLIETVQRTAENYLFDSKILAVIENEDEIESLALKNIDGVIFQKILK